jgi:hypothetical protein
MRPLGDNKPGCTPCGVAYATCKVAFDSGCFGVYGAPSRCWGGVCGRFGPVGPGSLCGARRRIKEFRCDGEIKVLGLARNITERYKMTRGLKRLRNSIYLSVLIFTVCGVLGLSFGGLFLYADGKEEPDFFFNSDPEFELVRVRYLGKMTNSVSMYILYANGRLLYKRTDYSGERIFIQSEVELSHDQVTDLVNQIVNSGLMEASTSKLKQKMGIGKHRLYTSSDSSTMHFIVNLESYRPPGHADAQPATINLSLENPTGSRLRYPDIEEIQCITSVAQELIAYSRGTEE